jgi:hypothetical protein
VTNRSYIQGDFQTPPELASEVWRDLGSLREVNAVIEPTVGTGVFLQTAPRSLLGCRWLCFDLNAGYLDQSCEIARGRGFANARIEKRDAFDLSADLLSDLDPRQPLLAIGNPPWVTSAGQGGFRVQNLPEKSNGKFGLTGLDAMTGKANFDIAEAILLRLLDAVDGFHDVRFAFLVKRSVAMRLSRRLLGTASELSFARIDAKAHFGAGVDAGIFVLRLTLDGRPATSHVQVASEIGGPVVRRAGFRNGRFVEDLDGHSGSAHLEATEPVPWRQGVKHDAAKVLELTPTDGKLVNGFGETVAIEQGVLCPLYKGSDVANDRGPRRVFPLFQFDLSGPLTDLDSRWPLLAEYLEKHAAVFAARRSRIYTGKPPFSIFGVGSYTLAPWKVVVSGLYSTARFRVIGPSSAGQPSLVDDTCYLLPFEHEVDAHTVADHLNDRGPQQLLRAVMDKGAKRPITKALLARVEIPVRPTEPSSGPGHPGQVSFAG